MTYSDYAKDTMSFLTGNFTSSVNEMGLKGNTITLKANQEHIHDILHALKVQQGFNHLSDVTCVDYIDESEFEVIYHLRSHAAKIRCNVKVRIPRESAHIATISDIWPGAQVHERENHELFGIVFKGNPDLSPLFLEDWEEIPPFRKDFDTREYVKKELGEF